MNIDIIIFTGFLVINLGVGLFYGRSVKTLRDYALGGMQFTTSKLVATVVATGVSGSMLFSALEMVYQKKILAYITVILGFCTSHLLVGQLLAPRMSAFIGKLSVGEAMGELYGKKVRMLTGITAILGATAYIAAQFKVSSKIFAMLFDINSQQATIIAACIVIFYSAFGGIRSVTFTDLIQFLTFGFFLPVIAFLALQSIKTKSALGTAMPLTLDNFVMRPIPKLSLLSIFLLFAVPSLDCFFFQRVAMSKNPLQVKRVFTCSALLFLIFGLLVTGLCTLIASAYPELSAKTVFPQLMADHSTFIGLKGGLAACVMAMVMSTADSAINASTVLFVNDILRPAGIKGGNDLWVARLFAASFGLLALFFALWQTGIWKLIVFAHDFYIPTILPLLLLAIFGFRSTSRTAMYGIGAAFLTVFLWRTYLEHTGINEVFPAIMANVTVFLTSHYLLREPGGWVGVEDRRYLDAHRKGFPQANDAGDF